MKKKILAVIMTSLCALVPLSTNLFATESTSTIKPTALSPIESPQTISPNAIKKPAPKPKELNVTTFVNSKKVTWSISSYVDAKGIVWVPVKYVSSALSAKATYYSSSKKMSIKRKDGIITTMYVGKKDYTLGRLKKKLGVAPLINKGRKGEVFVPLQFVKDGLTTTLSYDKTKRYLKVNAVVNNGYKVPEEPNTDIKVPPVDDPVGTELSIGIMLFEELEPQYTEAQKVLASKFGDRIATEIINYIKQKDHWRDDLPEKQWKVKDQRIMTGSEPGNDFVYIVIKKPGV